MKSHLHALIDTAIAQLRHQGVLPEDSLDPVVERTRDGIGGDYATNLALASAKTAKMPPRALAEKIIECLPGSSLVDRVEIAGPGFINFWLAADAYHNALLEILKEAADYGRLTLGAGEKIQVEFVSANPTGPLHVGHGRGAAYGAALANLLDFAGYQVDREYYVNDAGRQMDILALSVWLRYLELCGEKPAFPTNGYQGEYIREIAETLLTHAGRRLHHPATRVEAELPPESDTEGSAEIRLDQWILRCKALLGESGYETLHSTALTAMTNEIRQDLGEFSVHYDIWFSEKSLVASGALDEAIETLKTSNHLYQQDGAWWFRSTDFGDSKDRVVIRDNGDPTYFASDIAYHLNKLQRGYRRIINIWGADHHGYIARVKAALMALNAPADLLEVMLVQFAVLYRGGEKIGMSTRSGQFVTLRELRDEVGSDAARFFYVQRKPEQHMDFDLDLAKSESSDNPVYYVQYAHARICSVLRQLPEKGLSYQAASTPAELGMLESEREAELLRTLARFPELIETAAAANEPHQIAYYLRELANQFHGYYNAEQFLVDDPLLRNARLTLITGAAQVLRNGLTLLGVSAPERM
ncbi:MAG: arginine--tRNA ligase [Gammaproteobacteria bacterium]|nr:arginine--tRNA ligase [Gammaproteobacteria bacterium]